MVSHAHSLDELIELTHPYYPMCSIDNAISTKFPMTVYTMEKSSRIFMEPQKILHSQCPLEKGTDLEVLCLFFFILIVLFYTEKDDEWGRGQRKRGRESQRGSMLVLSPTQCSIS